MFIKSSRNGLFGGKRKNIFTSDRFIRFSVGETVGTVSGLMIDKKLAAFSATAVLVEKAALVICKFGARSSEGRLIARIGNVKG
jgi:hypothetical protein